MGKVVFHNNPDPEQQDLERSLRYAELPFAEKLKELFALIDLAVKRNGDRPLKAPQGKGIVIRKPTT